MQTPVPAVLIRLEEAGADRLPGKAVEKGESFARMRATLAQKLGIAQMIQSHEAFEAILEEATRLLEAHPAEGSTSYERLISLMRAIAAYRPATVADERKIASESERLSLRLDKFESTLPPHLSTHWHSMIGGDLGSGKSS